MDDSFNFSLFSCLLSVENSLLTSLTLWKYASKEVPLHIKKWEISRNEVTYNSYIKSKTRRKLVNLRKACKRRVSEFKISELITSFSTSMTARIFFIVINIGKVRDPGTLSYHVTDNS